ncbi:MAG: hypothetical protein OXI01_00670 [Albidovulum sp.]|nr:hypothetical protein [Albidovulum sp.]
MIDLDFYPIIEVETRAAIVTNARAGMAEAGSAIPPGFVRDCGNAAMRCESLALEPFAHGRAAGS